MPRQKFFLDVDATLRMQLKLLLELGGARSFLNNRLTRARLGLKQKFQAINYKIVKIICWGILENLNLKGVNTI